MNQTWIAVGKWWRLRGSATYSQWRTARRPYTCSEMDDAIKPGERYIEAIAPPWHDISGTVIRDGKAIRVWSRIRLCQRHTSWAPPL